MSDLERPEQDDQPNMPSRRDFLRTAAAGAALVGLGGNALAAPPPEGGKPKPFNTKEGDDVHTGMLYRAIPVCKIRISSIGCSPAGDESLRRMVQLGCNWFHKLDGCGSREFRQSLDWSKFYSDVVIDHVGRQEAIDEFEARRNNAGVEVVHFFKIHGTLGNPEQLKTVTSIFEAFETLRDQGKTKWLAASLHAGPDMLDACVEDGRFKMIQICYNPAGSNDAWIAAMKKAQAAGIAVIVMKSMAGGPKKWAESEAAKAVLQHYFDEGATPAVAMLRWILAQQGVTSIVPDCPNVQIAEENCSAGGAKMTAWEREGIERWAGAMSGIWCRSCRTCEGSCPRVLPIPDLLRYRMYSKDYGNVAGARKLYAALDEDRRASACIDCGACEKACPYGLQVRSFLADAHRRLS